MRAKGYVSVNLRNRRTPLVGSMVRHRITHGPVGNLYSLLNRALRFEEIGYSYLIAYQPTWKIVLPRPQAPATGAAVREIEFYK